MRKIAQELASIAQMAGLLLKRMQGRRLPARFKAPAELVTSADRTSHKILFRELSKRFAPTPIILEEQEHAAKLPQRYFVADELDGTSVYSHGLPDWGLTLAYIDKGRPLAGVLHQPIRNATVIAWKDGGAWIRGKKISLNPTCSLANSVLLVELNRHLRDKDFEWISRLASHVLVMRSLGTAVGSAFELILGHAGIYLNCRGAKVWDFAASVLAVQEAGGVAVKEDGGALDWSKLPIGVLLAANPQIASDALSLAKSKRTRLD